MLHQMIVVGGHTLSDSTQMLLYMPTFFQIVYLRVYINIDTQSKILTVNVNSVFFICEETKDIYWRTLCGEL